MEEDRQSNSAPGRRLRLYDLTHNEKLVGAKDIERVTRKKQQMNGRKIISQNTAPEKNYSTMSLLQTICYETKEKSPE